MTEIVDDQAPPAPPGGRTYNGWTQNDTVEDYSLRYAPKSFRRWSPYVVATTALGGIAYLADFAIGGSIAVSHGFSSALVAILTAAVVIFLTGIPISVLLGEVLHRHGPADPGRRIRVPRLDAHLGDLRELHLHLLRPRGSIMAQALQLGLHIPLAVGYVVCSLVILPLVVHGMTALSRMQVWTQPVWLVLMVAPFVPSRSRSRRNSRSSRTSRATRPPARPSACSVWGRARASRCR
ncbi:hypothetical protein LT493_43565 [Streptomyces tricolor]|nr:hypothetical protein [Streptomyces tricolor]